MPVLFVVLVATGTIEVTTLSANPSEIQYTCQKSVEIERSFLQNSRAEPIYKIFAYYLQSVKARCVPVLTPTSTIFLRLLAISAWD